MNDGRFNLRPVSLAVALFPIVVSAAGCEDRMHATPQCTPGASVACACTNGQTGAQVCAPNGTFLSCACAAANQSPTAATAATPATTGRPSTQPTAIRAQPWTLIVSGTIDGTSPDDETTLEAGDVRFADIDGDGYEEAIVNVIMGFGGAGAATCVEVFTMRPGDTTPRRIHAFDALNSMEGYLTVGGLEGRKIILHRDTILEGDAYCCPSRRQVEYWTWNGQAMVEEVARRQVTRAEPPAR